MIAITASGTRLPGFPALTVGERIAVLRTDGTRLVLTVAATTVGNRVYVKGVNGGISWQLPFSNVTELYLLDR